MLFTWTGILLLVGAVIVGLKGIADYRIWLDFANTILLISIAISLLHLARKS